MNYFWIPIAILAPIECMRWSPRGDMLASVSWDATAALLDFRTGKKLYTGRTPDGSKFLIINEGQPFLFLFRTC